MLNLTFSIEDEPVAAIVTFEIWDSHKCKADTVDLDEGGRAGIYVIHSR